MFKDNMEDILQHLETGELNRSNLSKEHELLLAGDLSNYLDQSDRKSSLSFSFKTSAFFSKISYSNENTLPTEDQSDYLTLIEDLNFMTMG